MDEVLDKRNKYQIFFNDYESFIYLLKEKLDYDDVYIKVINKDEYNTLNQIIEKHKNSLQSENKPLTFEAIQNRYQQLINETEKIILRACEYVNRPIAFKHLNETLNKISDYINKIWPQTKPWIKDEEIQIARNAYNKSLNWFNEKYNEQIKRKDNEDPSVLSKEIESQTLLLEWTLKTINNTNSSSAKTSEEL